MRNLSPISLVVASCAFVAALSVAQVGVTQRPHDLAASEHFTEVAQRLELTESQKRALEDPFRRAHAAMMELQELHGEIAAQLDDEQKRSLATMLHERVGTLMATDAVHRGHHGSHPQH